jgi:hypothetical protein
MDPAREELEIEYFSRYDYRREAWEGSREIGDPDDIYPSDEEMIADGWYRDEDGVWQHPEVHNILDQISEPPDPDIPF